MTIDKLQMTVNKWQITKDSKKMTNYKWQMASDKQSLIDMCDLDVVAGYLDF